MIKNWKNLQHQASQKQTQDLTSLPLIYSQQQLQHQTLEMLLVIACPMDERWQSYFHSLLNLTRIIDLKLTIIIDNKQFDYYYFYYMITCLFSFLNKEKQMLYI